MGMALAARRGDLKNPSKKVSSMAGSMSMGDLEDFASTKRKKLAEHMMTKRRM
jgi:hypothetical protein